MKRITLIVIASLTLIPMAEAKDISVTLTDQDQANWSMMSAAFDQCVAGAVNRGDGGYCRNIAIFLANFAGTVKTAASSESAAAPSATAPAPVK